jgi:hypothetical protein
VRNCPGAETLYLYLEGELDAFERRRLEIHVEGCPACREALAERCLLHEAFTSLPPLEVPPDFALSVMDSLPEPAAAGRRGLAPLIAAMASLIVGLLGFYLLTGENLSDVLVAASRFSSSVIGRFLPLLAKMFKVGDLLLKVAADLTSMFVTGLGAFSRSLGPQGVGLILGLGTLLCLLVFFGAKRLLSVGEKT